MPEVFCQSIHLSWSPSLSCLPVQLLRVEDFTNGTNTHAHRKSLFDFFAIALMQFAKGKFHHCYWKEFLIQCYKTILLITSMSFVYNSPTTTHTRKTFLQDLFCWKCWNCFLRTTYIVISIASSNLQLHNSVVSIWK